MQTYYVSLLLGLPVRILGPRTIVDVELSRKASLNSAGICQSGRDTPITGENHRFGNVDTLGLEQFSQFTCRFDASIRADHFKTWHTNWVGDFAGALDCRSRSVFHDLNRAVCRNFIYALVWKHVVRDEIVIKIRVKGGLVLTFRWAPFWEPLGKTAIQHVHIRMAKGFEHKGSTCCEPVIGRRIDDNGLWFPHVKRLHHTHEVMFVRHHHKVRRLHISDNHQVKELRARDAWSLVLLEHVYLCIRPPGCIQDAKLVFRVASDHIRKLLRANKGTFSVGCLCVDHLSLWLK